MVRLDLVQRTMERETKTNVIFLDACRDNPLARNLARALGTRSMEIGRGLAAAESGVGTLISFSTQPGNVALDGEGRNSPFAKALSQHLLAKGEDVSTILIKVRNDVMAETRDRQVPWEHTALRAKLFFTDPFSPDEANQKLIEAQFWASVKDSKSLPAIQIYLERYPNGEFAALARARIAQLQWAEDRARASVAARDAELQRAKEARRELEAKRTEELRKADDTKRAEDLRAALDAAQRAREMVEQADAQRREALKAADDARKEADAARLASNSQRTKEAIAKEEARKAEDAQRATELRAALDAAKKAQDAVKALEQQQAKKAAAGAVAATKDAPNPGEARKLAALPSSETPIGPYDGIWMVKHVSANCSVKSGSRRIEVNGTRVKLFEGSGQITASGAVRWTTPSRTDGQPMDWSGNFQANSGSGSYGRRNGGCSGTFTAARE